MHSGRATVKGVLMGPVGAGSVTASGPAEREGALLAIEGALLEDLKCQTLLFLGTWFFIEYLRYHFWVCVVKLLSMEGYFVQGRTGPDKGKKKG